MRVRLLKTFARESGCGREGQILVDPPADYLSGLVYEVLDGLPEPPPVLAKPPEQELDAPQPRRGRRPKA